MLEITVSQAQFRWFALRRLLTSVFFAVSLAGVAALIVWVDYRMMFFAIVSVLFALIAVAYGVRMLRLAVSARTTAVLLTGTTLTRTVAGVAVAQPITGVCVYPSQLAVFLPGAVLVDLPIGKQRMADVVVSLERESIGFEEMSGWVGTLLPVLGGVLFVVVSLVLVRVVALALFSGLVATAMWSPWAAAAVLLLAAGGGLVSLVWGWLTAWSDRQV